MFSSKLLRITALSCLVGQSLANLLTSIPQKATASALKFQPYLDFDKDSCYNIAAIDAKGNLNTGLDPEKYPQTERCRTLEHMKHSNVYARQRCNNGWCAYMYAYYSEKDWNSFPVKTHLHRHEWEHIIVWTYHGKKAHVSWSAHSGYTTEAAKDIRWHGTHPKFVAHHGGALNNSFRKAKKSDDDHLENHYGRWWATWLLSIELMNPVLVPKLTQGPGGYWGDSARADFGDCYLGGVVVDHKFGDMLNSAMPSQAKGKFDPWLDDSGVGHPPDCP